MIRAAAAFLAIVALSGCQAPGAGPAPATIPASLAVAPPWLYSKRLSPTPRARVRQRQPEPVPSAAQSPAEPEPILSPIAGKLDDIQRDIEELRLEVNSK
jgi:hypothetical protein